MDPGSDPGGTPRAVSALAGFWPSAAKPSFDTGLAVGPCIPRGHVCQQPSGAVFFRSAPAKSSMARALLGHRPRHPSSLASSGRGCHLDRYAACPCCAIGFGGIVVGGVQPGHAPTFRAHFVCFIGARQRCTCGPGRGGPWPRLAGPATAICRHTGGVCGGLSAPHTALV